MRENANGDVVLNAFVLIVLLLAVVAAAVVVYVTVWCVGAALSWVCKRIAKKWRSYRV